MDYQLVMGVDRTQIGLGLSFCAVQSDITGRYGIRMDLTLPFITIILCVGRG
jgi:hypothetical protein